VCLATVRHVTWRAACLCNLRRLWLCDTSTVGTHGAVTLVTTITLVITITLGITITITRCRRV
jgi:hypothetical protein